MDMAVITWPLRGGFPVKNLLRSFLLTSQHAKVDLKLLIVSVIPIYSLSDIINLFCFLFFILINKLITFGAS
jgi:hypothetical protein